MRKSEYGKIIAQFPNYEVTNFGRVFNISTGREMVLSPTIQGDLTVGLMRDGHQYRRSVKVLVARTFVEGEDEIFDTPIQIDGNKENLNERNLVWRPRWFAWEYGRQFTHPQEFFFNGPIQDLDNKIQYETLFEAATARGLLCKNIRKSIITKMPVFPTGERYAMDMWEPWE